MDSFAMYKPVGWTNNATARASQLSSFEPNVTLGENWIDTFGIDNAIVQSVSHCFATPTWSFQLKPVTKLSKSRSQLHLHLRAYQSAIL